MIHKLLFTNKFAKISDNSIKNNKDENPRLMKNVLFISILNFFHLQKQDYDFFSSVIAPTL